MTSGESLVPSRPTSHAYETYIPKPLTPSAYAAPTRCAGTKTSSSNVSQPDELSHPARLNQDSSRRRPSRLRRSALALELAPLVSPRLERIRPTTPVPRRRHGAQRRPHRPHRARRPGIRPEESRLHHRLDPTRTKGATRLHHGRIRPRRSSPIHEHSGREASSDARRLQRGSRGVRRTVRTPQDPDRRTRPKRQTRRRHNRVGPWQIVYLQPPTTK